MTNKIKIKPSNCSASDVASYLIKLSDEVGEPLTNMKLQKLLYYSYAWYLVEKENLETLFQERFKAWQYGPVIVEVYDAYKDCGADVITRAKSDLGSPDNVGEDAKKLIKEVFLAYADKTAIQLMRLTHTETPWLETYDATNLQKVISDEAIFKFYLEKKKASLS